MRNVSALRNYWAGLMAADGMKILGGHYNDNDQLGIGGNAATGVLLDGLDGDTATFDGPELARNHALHASPEYEAGGMKWDVGQVTIRNVHAHHNDYRGLWADMNARERAGRAQPGGGQLGGGSLLRDQSGRGDPQ